MKIMLTPERIRSAIADARTESDAALALRRHRIRYGFSTEGGYTHIRIPVRSGIVRIYRTASRSAPLTVTFSARTAI